MFFVTIKKNVEVSYVIILINLVGATKLRSRLDLPIVAVGGTEEGSHSPAIRMYHVVRSGLELDNIHSRLKGNLTRVDSVKNVD